MRQRTHYHPEVLGKQSIRLYPLHQDSVRCQMCSGLLVKFVCKKRSDSRNPRIRRFRDDQIILIPSREKKAARVVHDYMEPRVANYAMVQRLEVRSRVNYRWFYLHAIDSLDFRVLGYRESRHAASKANDEYLLRRWMHQHTQMSEHHLCKLVSG